VVVWRKIAELQHRVLLESQLLAVDGQWEVQDGVCHLIAHHLRDLSHLLGSLDTRSRDFHSRLRPARGCRICIGNDLQRLAADADTDNARDEALLRRSASPARSDRCLGESRC
jgi:hypothetical protein